MRIILGGVCQPTLDGSSVSIRRSMSDPVPTCTLNLIDNNSSIVPVAMQELLVIDDQVIPNPTVNLLLNPSLNPYSTSWTAFGPGTGETVSQPGGGGIKNTFANAPAPPNNNVLIQQLTQVGTIVPGQTYTLSFYAQAVSPVNIQINVNMIWYAQSGTAGGNIGVLNLTTVPSTSLTRYTLRGVAPAQAACTIVQIGTAITSSTNSGSITFTQVQLEPNWIATLSYPLPWCGPSQTNCVQLPLGYWIRQYRKFAGFVNHALNGDYHGNVRTVTVSGVGYAWLMGLVNVNDTFSNKTDAQIISTLLGYLTSNGTAMLTTTYVVTGTTLTTFGSNWDDIRTLFDNIASQSGFYWTVNDYWDMIYAPPGYFAMAISLLCDNSGTPDMSTTFPAYDFSSEMDYSQPGSTVLVLGSGTNSAKVMDGSTTMTNGIVSGYSLPTGSSYMRKINESTLGSNADCVTRGIAEMIQYDTQRSLYHLTTNVELISGQSIQLTSATENITAKSLLLQTVTSNWLGTDETRNDYWAYVADLGDTNRATVNILSRLFRLANSNTSAVAIGTTSLVLFERMGLQDVSSQGSVNTSYQATILADAPLAYYRLGELSGTIADDYSGNGNVGALHGGITLAQASLLTTSPAGNSMTFNGTTGYISLPTSMVPTGAHAWSVECWVRVSSLPAASYSALAGMGTRGVQQMGVIFINNASSVWRFVLSTFSGDITGTTPVTINNNFHVVGTYDGTKTRLYVNGTLDAGPTSFTMNMTAGFASIGADGTSQVDWMAGRLQEAAFYNSALSAAQVLAHYNAR